MVEDGDKAVDCYLKLNEVKSECNINIIFMDLNMKNMNGDKATSQVKYFNRLNI